MGELNQPLGELGTLQELGFDIKYTSHARAILMQDFGEALAEIAAILGNFRIAVHEIVRGGGGETPFTQRLRRSLHAKGWEKQNFIIRKLIGDVETQATSHEVDHVKVFSGGTVALEIEWNNKDPFFDRDLDNFKRLHADSGISAAIIITRGSTLQSDLDPILMRFAEANELGTFADLEKFDLFPTRRQKAYIEGRVEAGLDFKRAWVTQFRSDKFGEATTHWRKLDDRITRGAGNPCPLLLLGLPSGVLIDEPLPEEGEIDGGNP